MAEHTAAHHSEEDHGHHDFVIEEQGIHHVHGSKKEIWRVFFILLGITILEFLVALTPAIYNGIGKTGTVSIFFTLTILKAFYIVGYFMHLRHEKLNMAYTILVPLGFVLYLIALLLIEGGAQAHVG
jgi:cytochrome c oxidase subunit IV